MKRANGFTLIELMIVVAVVAILAAIGYPSYQESVRKSARKMGTAALMETLGRQEQYFLNNKRYATDLQALGYPANGYYVNSDGQNQAAAGGVYLIQLAAGATATTFTLEAVPQGGQASDTSCGTLTLTSNGARSQSGTGTQCW